MINNKELRIGNFVLAPTGVNNNPEWEKVIEIGSLRVVVYNSGEINDAAFSYTDVQPIPLTDEVLRQCKFLFNYPGDASISGLTLHKEDKGYFLKEMFGYINKKPITALHEIQNLYFDLTGLECMV